MLKKSINILSVLLSIIAVNGCVETFDFESEIEDFDSALVIEATITNELIFQEISLSRTFQLDTIPSFPESNARVKIIDDHRNEFNFEENELGTYISTKLFAAEPNRDYQLEIETSNGRLYSSKMMQLTQATNIETLAVERGIRDDGIEGVSIYVDSHDTTGNSKYYRYTYEETYKIIAPSYSAYEIVFNEGSFVDYQILLRSEPEQTCYNTVKSNRIILNNTTNLAVDNVDHFLVRFIGRDNYIMSYRYSILVKQYVQSFEAYSYYSTLKDLSESESLLSQNQPGIVIGNVFSKANTNEKVLGYFEVSSVHKKRVYFNYDDLFSGEDLPPYAVGCDTYFAPAVGGETTSHPLYDHIAAGFQYFETYDSNFTFPIFPLEGPEVLITRECGDCTALGSTDIPEFWIE